MKCKLTVTSTVGFVKMCEIVKNVLSTATFEVCVSDQSFIRLRSLDPTQVCMIMVTYPVTVTPHTTGSFRFSVDIQKLYKALKTCDHHGLLELALTDENLKVRCTSEARFLEVNCRLTVTDGADDSIQTSDLRWQHVVCMSVEDLKTRTMSAKDFKCQCVRFALYPDIFEVALLENSDVIVREQWRVSRLSTTRADGAYAYEIGKPCARVWDHGHRRPVACGLYPDNIVNCVLRSMSKTTLEIRLGAVDGGDDPPLALIHSLGQSVGEHESVIRFFLASVREDDDDDSMET